jgi:SAM-dependent methyltransferase
MSAAAVRRLRPAGAPEPLRLQIGAGTSTLEGFVNCDLHAGPTVDHVFDCQRRWPFPDAVASEVYASHMLEHLADPLAFFREAHRVLQPGGVMTLRFPYGGHKAAWWDITHLRPWYPENFHALQPGYGDRIGNPQWNEWPALFDVSLIQVALADDVLDLIRPWWRRALLLGPLLKYGTNVSSEITIFATALKSPEAVARFRAHNPDGLLFIRWGTMRWRWEQRAPREGEGLKDFVALAQTYSKFGRCI